MSKISSSRTVVQQKVSKVTVLLEGQSMSRVVGSLWGQIYETHRYNLNMDECESKCRKNRLDETARLRIETYSRADEGDEHQQG